MILVRDAMCSELVSVDIETTLRETCRIMGKKHIGSVIVTRKEKPEGIFTERDLLSKVFLEEIDLNNAKVGDHMSKPLTVINADYELKEAAKAMSQLRVRRLPVMENGKLLGIITSADIVMAMAKAPRRI